MSFEIDTGGLRSDSSQALGVGASPTFVGLTLSGMTQGSVLFAGAGGAASQDNAHFFWDAANKRLGIGTAAPGYPLSLDSGGAGLPLFNITNAGANPTFIGNASNLFVGGNAADLGIRSGLALMLGSNGANTPVITLTLTGSLVIGTAAIATNATDGFIYIPTCAGTLTGVPSAQTGRVAMVYDTTNNEFWIYDGGWKEPKTPAGAALVTWQ